MANEIDPPVDPTPDSPSYEIDPPVDTPTPAVDVSNLPDHAATAAPAVPLIPRPNITIRHAVTKPYTIKPTDNSVSLMNISFADLEQQPDSLESSASTALSPDWLLSITNGVHHYYNDHAFDRSMSRDGSDWRQGVQHDGGYISPGAPQIGAKPGQLLTGLNALMRVQALSGGIPIVQIPLWHTGIWVKLKAPTDSDLLELDRAIANAKVSLGRSTMGSIFSNESVYMNTILARFVCRFVYACSLTDDSIENLLRTIRATDIPTLVWGLACVIYSNGYPLKRPCINNPRTCHHVENALLNVSKMCVTDNAELTKWQRDFMINPEATRSVADIEKYQSIIIEKQGTRSTIPFNANINIQLGVPSILEYEESGHRWIDGIVKMTEGAATMPLEGNMREQYISDQAKLTRLRQYGHWIRAIVLADDERIVDIASIEETLTALSSNDTWSDEDDAAEHVLNKIAEFADNVTITVIGIPRYECPACGALQSDDYEKHPEIIVQDVVKLFFTLVSHRILASIARRQ